MKFPRILALTAAVLGISMSIHAQTTYPVVVPETFTVAQPAVSEMFILDLPATGPLMEYPTLYLQYINLSADAQNAGNVRFANVEGPDGYLSNANVVSSTVAGNTITLNLSGHYAPASGGGEFTGTLTIIGVFKTERINRYKVATVFEVLSGTVTINSGGTASPDSPIAPTPVCLPGDKGGCPPHDL